MKKIVRKIKNIKDVIIALKKKGEQKEMPVVNCPNCQGKKRSDSIILKCEHSAKIQGIIQCLRCEHEFPITIVNDTIQKIDVALPGIQSDKLNQSVEADIKEDVEEAERCNYHQCYKACVTMCRRALQLGLIDKGITDTRLSLMLQGALKDKLIEQKTYDLATSIKGYGDIGAHRREHLEPKEVELVIYATVKMLNELFQ